MGFGVIILALTQIGSLAVPYFIGQMLDAINDPDKEEDAKREDLAAISTRLCIILGFTSVLLFFRGFIFNGAGERVVARLRIQLFSAILQQEIAFFDKNKTGELLSRLSSDTAKLQDAATSSVSMFIRTAMGIVISLAMMLITSWKLTCVMLVSVPVLVFFAVCYGRFVKRLAKAYTDALAKAADIATESISNIRTTRAFAAEDVEKNKYMDLIGDPDDFADRSFCWYPKKMSTQKLGIQKAMGHGGFIGVVGGLGQFTMVGLMFYGGDLVLKKEMTAGTLVTFMMYSLNVGMSLAIFAGLFSAFMEAIGASTRTFEIVDREPALSLRGGEKVKLEGEIDFDQVKFHYPSRPDIEVLNNFTLNIKKNTTVALVGQSGGGKSTVISLLERFYDVVGGEIRLDGKNIKDLDPSVMRNNFGLVAQEPVLFGVSILDNICYGAASLGEGVSKERVEEVAKMANAHEFISKFPEGYDTMVGERGIKLSGGQKQRIAIARALLMNPSVLLLDEATSALDAESEGLVQGAINEVMKGRTVVVVAHRLSTIKNADCIVMIKNHQIVDKGTHDELMARCGDYQELVRKQLSARVEA